MSHTIEMRRYRGSDGISLVADVGGDPSAAPVILLHGGGQTRHSWRGVMQELLSRGYHVINLDARGHGDSDWSPDGIYSLDALAADLRSVVATLSAPPVLVGASMGGATSLYAVGTSTGPFASALVLVDIVPQLDPDGAQKIMAFMNARPDGFATLEEAVDAVAAYNPHRPRPRDTAGLMKNLRRHADGRLYWHWDPRILEAPQRPEPPVFADQLHQAAKHVRIPTLLVRGLKSDLVSDEGIAELRHYLPHLEVYDVVGAGHMVAGDKNDAFNDGVLGFLHRHMPPTIAIDNRGKEQAPRS